VPIITIVFGGMLTALGLIGFVLTGSQHPTALIPAIVGTILEFCGGLALKPKFRMHAMHGAAMVGMLGFLGCAIMLFKAGLSSAPIDRPAVLSQSIMGGLCLVFVILCVLSFVNARRRRLEGGPTSSTPS
jgi:hypothetical protein